MDVAVSLVESYLRLNGYFTVTEFQVQQPMAGQPGRFETATDLDILGVVDNVRRAGLLIEQVEDLGLRGIFKLIVARKPQEPGRPGGPAV